MRTVQVKRKLKKAEKGLIEALIELRGIDTNPNIEEQGRIRRKLFILNPLVEAAYDLIQLIKEEDEKK